ncbi:MAG TPA: Xaa-Pro aminopeptidase [Candidatus Cloacimonadota bacterium]|nr:Xaa-Pro aminopeptidase [Candidatus Cloacimonadota bacterium]HPS39224.1 Xaa-Pro aminopeptidase [Candidatus Cloacimonadota bacterium]
MNSEITSTRRNKLGTYINDREAVVLFANREGNLEKFTQENNFLYLTGLMAPDAILFLTKNQDMLTEHLFIERGIPEREVWDGKKMTKEEAVEITGITRVHYLDEFYDYLGSYAGSLTKIFANIGMPSLKEPPTFAMFTLQPLRERFPLIVIQNVTELITPLRKVKDKWEIMQLQRAIDITGKGILDIMEGARSGMMEFELEAMLFYRMQRSGAKTWGFAPIIATGLNAATLHYKKNECRIENGEVILLDVGAAYMNYSADITRCFPIGASFSERQRAVYNAVLSVQKQIIELIKPGVTLSHLQITTRELITEALIGLGLIENPEDFSKYYMHGVSHFLGMDTHDLGGREAVLEPGNVITVEPGIYIPEERLGIRIEDDVLVTEEGYCVLSQNIPKETAEIEAIRQAALAEQ